VSVVVPSAREPSAFTRSLVDAGLLIPTRARGVYGRGAVFEDVRLRFGSLITAAAAADRAEPVAFPPVVPRADLDDVGYFDFFPHLAGSIFELDDDGPERRQRMTELALLPAACYPVYPAVARRGPLPEGGLTIDTGPAYVFRREPSDDPTRLQMFQLRELVRIGAPDDARVWRDAWLERGGQILSGLGLDTCVDVASDPFFGRAGTMLAENQRTQQLKFELRVEIVEGQPTAVASFNYHQDHFGTTFGIRTAAGEVAHSACLGFGEERVTIALFHRHGLDVERWPANVRRALWGAEHGDAATP
jgi:seryl-tRNA synthetase